MKNTQTLKIARKYSEALAEISVDEKLLDELTALQESFSPKSEFSQAINHPQLKSEAKIQIIQTALKGKVDESIVKLLCVLVQRRRLELVPYLAEAYRDSLNKRKNTARAKISTATKLEDAELANIKSELERIFSKDIEIEVSDDAELIAGHKIDVDGTVIDSSLKSKLKQMKQLLR